MEGPAWIGREFFGAQDFRRPFPPVGGEASAVRTFAIREEFIHYASCRDHLQRVMVGTSEITAEPQR